MKTYSNMDNLTLLLIIVLLITLVLVGCNDHPAASEKSSAQEYNHLPLGAMDVTHLGNNWVVFEIDHEGKTHTILMYNTHRGYSGYGAMTELSKP